MYYIFVEILKNSIKSTLDKYNITGYLEDINILICNNSDNITIKISDKGNGIKYYNLKHVWSYFYSTSKIQRLNLNNDEIKDFDKTTPLAGFGYGLPITKLSVEYFNDDIFINSIEDMGTDVLLHFQKNII
jgi:signal transduction histidine kinase